ncbi:cell division protein ZapA [bacterium]|nr:cell division protein ZapA [bacterium]
MCPDENVLRVRIYGAEYSIRGPSDANYIKVIAEYVDNKMREVDKNVRVDSSLKVAILATLNITDELFKEREDKERIRIQLEDKIKKLNARIDQQLSKKTH